jgi:hypothetical protein
VLFELEGGGTYNLTVDHDVYLGAAPLRVYRVQITYVLTAMILIFELLSAEPLLNVLVDSSVRTAGVRVKAILVGSKSHVATPVLVQK